MRARRPVRDVIGTVYVGAALATVAAANPQAGSGIPVRTLAYSSQRIADGPARTASTSWRWTRQREDRRPADGHGEH